MSDSNTWIPAPYGQACTGCSRAKSKCFFRGLESRCERCQRLSISCVQKAGVRKRKTRPSPQPQPQPSPVVNSRLEEKLDDIVTLLRSGATLQRGHPSPASLVPDGGLSNINSPLEYTGIPSPSQNNCPDVAIAPSANTIDLFPSSNSDSPLGIILTDVSVHTIDTGMAEEQLDIFRRGFLPMFPMIHLPPDMSSVELRTQKPFCWFVMMTLTTKQVSKQFDMESTIWHIISNRIVCQHLINLDLLLGLICFSSWSVNKSGFPFNSSIY